MLAIHTVLFAAGAALDIVARRSVLSAGSMAMVLSNRCGKTEMPCKSVQQMVWCRWVLCKRCSSNLCCAQDALALASVDVRCTCVLHFVQTISPPMGFGHCSSAVALLTDAVMAKTKQLTAFSASSLVSYQSRSVRLLFSSTKTHKPAK